MGITTTRAPSPGEWPFALIAYANLAVAPVSWNKFRFNISKIFGARMLIQRGNRMRPPGDPGSRDLLALQQGQNFVAVEGRKVDQGLACQRSGVKLARRPNDIHPGATDHVRYDLGFRQELDVCTTQGLAV
ncbi:hypothetical protein D6827_02035 [Candidatus Parcubacteria bacterium]|nr:MAG: hypothetical protein D6827_02035 [Candidatus Parcubacteria bacterium]